jgi:hypothetical protein
MIRGHPSTSSIRGTMHISRPSSSSSEQRKSPLPTYPLYIRLHGHKPRAGCACDLGLRDVGVAAADDERVALSSSRGGSPEGWWRRARLRWRRDLEGRKTEGADGQEQYVARRRLREVRFHDPSSLNSFFFSALLFRTDRGIFFFK